MNVMVAGLTDLDAGEPGGPKHADPTYPDPNKDPEHWFPGSESSLH
jgi:hypothetical protein